MDEIRRITPNGFNVISTFSGCGGSCLGYRMAGYRVLWANEFVSAARDTYKANYPDGIVDGRDIRTVQPNEILKAVSLEQGDLDLLDGSPPCASFSTAGKREKEWGKVKLYSDTHQRTDDLFFEYARILRGLQPKVFVAENVSGLVRGTVKGYFKLILKELKSCGYRVEARLLDAQWLGVPQMRQRVIFVGVRNDIQHNPAFPKPLPWQYSVKDACPWFAERPESPLVPDHEADISRYSISAFWEQVKPGETHPKRFNLCKPALDRPCPTITATGGNIGSAAVCHPFEKRKFTIAELKRLSAFPDDFILTGPYAKQWERIGRSVPPVMMYHVAAAIRSDILCKLK
jgi:DNA (cytosine-5)-methyltransferase 1